MNYQAVLFDLDGTLLPMDQDTFTGEYFKQLAAKLAPYGYEAETLYRNLWAGVAAMVLNDGSRLNEVAFWEKFTELYGQQVLDDLPVFDEFYRLDFDNVKVSCGYHPAAKEIIEGLKAAGKTIILATNPLFPPAATEHRIRWAGLDPKDFLFYTTYDNSKHCKPNPAYYTDILEQAGLKPEDCLMVGNDVYEDMVAAGSLEIRGFLLTDCLINKKDFDISIYPQGSFDELKKFLGLE